MKDEEKIKKEVLKERFPDIANCCEDDLQQLIDEYGELIDIAISKTAKAMLKKAELGAIKWVRAHSFDSGCSDVCKNIVIGNIKEEFEKLKKNGWKNADFKRTSK